MSDSSFDLTSQLTEAWPINDKQTKNITVDLCKLSQLVADAVVSVPEYLTPEQLTELCCLVKRFRRKRLVKYIARSIAMDIYLENGL